MLFSTSSNPGSYTEFINDYNGVNDQLVLFNMRMLFCKTFGTSFVNDDFLNQVNMPLLFIPNIAFTSFIKIDGRVHEFNFRKKNEAVFEADSTDERGNRIIFELGRDSENWSITSKNLPSWVTRHEDLVVEAIEKQ